MKNKLFDQLITRARKSFGISGDHHLNTAAGTPDAPRP